MSENQSRSVAADKCFIMDDKSKAANVANQAPVVASNQPSSNLKDEKSGEVKDQKMEHTEQQTGSISGEKAKESSMSANEEVEAKKSEIAASSDANKRPREVSEEDLDESAKKKTKKDDNTSSSSSTVATSEPTISAASSAVAPVTSTTVSSKPSRGTRGSLSEKSEKAGKGAKRGTEKRASPTSSALNSPKKPSSRDQSDEEDAESAKKSASSNNEPKVPPLKIVLSGSTGSNASEDKKSPTGGNKDDGSKETEKSGGKDMSESADNANATSHHSPNLEAFDDNDSKGAVGTNTRLTRSRANQGTPGPGDDSPNMSQCENANLEPATKEPAATATTSNVSSQNSQSSSDRLNYADYHVKKRKLRSQVDQEPGGSSLTNVASASTSAVSGGDPKCQKSSSSTSGEPLNDIEKYLNIRKQVEQRRKNLFPVQPKPPQGFKDYLMNRKTYLLQGNAHERLRSIPMIQPPHSLDGPLRELFKQQEEERYKLRLKHVVEKEKLVLAVEQEILRVHGRAARALANQSLPYSVCTILRDEEIYTPIDPQQEEKNRDIRSRYNGRLFLSWLQDVDDKWEKIKEQMVLRHHNEAESLNAVQKMDWEWKVNEITGSPANDGGNGVLQMDDLHIPMVHVSDDFDMSIS